MSDWHGAIERMLGRIRVTAEQVGGAFPHWARSSDGHWVTTPDGDWTGGYFVGMAWLAWRLTGDSAFRAAAAEHTLALRRRAADDTVFKGFPFYYGAAVGWVAARDEAAREVALEGARGLGAMFDVRLGLVPLGGAAEEGASIGSAETSIDSLQAGLLMLWAGREGEDERLAAAGRAHARRVIDLHLRDDGSFIQSTSLDPETGEVRRHYTHKGFSDTSTWGRAQAWGMLFSLRSGHRSAAETGARWWLERVPADRVAYWDFDDPAIPDTERDTAATAIAANALLKLGGDFAAAGEATVGTLVDLHLSPVGAITHCCFNKRPDSRPEDAAASCEFVVGDYYLFESLLILAGHLAADRL